MSKDHGLRTTGQHTGNFGRPKVQGKPGVLEVSRDILKRENLRIAPREEAYDRLKEALAKTSDPRMIEVLGHMVRSHEASRIRR